MNGRKILVGILLPALCLLALLTARYMSAEVENLDGQPSGAAAPAEKDRLAEDKAPPRTNTPAETPVRTERDPFSATSAGVSVSGIPSGFKVQGVLVMKSGARLATLKVPGCDHLVMVCEKDTVRAGRPDGVAVGVVVKRILDDGAVEVALVDDPSSVITLR